MKCPLSQKECDDPSCAWYMGNRDARSCAVAEIAQRMKRK